MSRNFEEPELHVFYDAGAGSIKATLVEFSYKVGAKKADGNATIVNVKGVGWDRTVGGIQFDLILRDLLAKRFMDLKGKQVKTHIRDNPRAMSRLLKEANRVKHVLSANAESVSSVESLAEDLDFRTKISRTDFEAACEAHKAKFVQPIQDALKQVGKSIVSCSLGLSLLGHKADLARLCCRAMSRRWSSSVAPRGCP